MDSLIIQPDMARWFVPDLGWSSALAICLWVLSLLLALLCVVEYIRLRRIQRLARDARAHVMLSEARRLGKRRAAEREWGAVAEDVQ